MKTPLLIFLVSLITVACNPVIEDGVITSLGFEKEDAAIKEVSYREAPAKNQFYYINDNDEIVMTTGERNTYIPPESAPEGTKPKVEKVEGIPKDIVVNVNGTKIFIESETDTFNVIFSEDFNYFEDTYTAPEGHIIGNVAYYNSYAQEYINAQGDIFFYWNPCIYITTIDEDGIPTMTMLRMPTKEWSTFVNNEFPYHVEFFSYYENLNNGINEIFTNWLGL